MPSGLALRPLGNTGLHVSPLGMSASYRPGEAAIRFAAEEGINLFFSYGFDFQMIRALRELMRPARERFVLMTGAYNYIWRAQDVRKACEKRLRQFQTEYIDLFLFMGVMKPGEFTPAVRGALQQLKSEGKIKAIGLSCHNRKFLGSLAAEGSVDAMMLRYNAAHRGAEEDIFPHLQRHNPGVVSYTATRWSYLVRRPKGWPKDGRVPTAGECYRFVLSNPHVHATLTAPRNLRELKENIAAVRSGPLPGDDLRFMQEFGDVIHRQKKYFM